MTEPSPSNDVGLCERLREDYAINLDWPVSAKIVVIDMNRERYQASDTIERLTARVAELEGALRPFSEVGAAIDVAGFGEALFRDDEVAFESRWTENGNEKSLKWSAFRQARSVLNGEKGRLQRSSVSASVPTESVEKPVIHGGEP